MVCVCRSEHARSFANVTRDGGILLSRSAWAGSNGLGAAVWSGDTRSEFAWLKLQIPAGLNMAMSGQLWWTTDAGGFIGGNSDDPAFRELYVRWLQFATVCPIMRTHGTRSCPQSGKETRFLRHFDIKTIVLPRQARDRHRKNYETTGVSLGHDGFATCGNEPWSYGPTTGAY